MAIIIGAGDSITYGNWDRKGGWLCRLRNYLDKKNLADYKGDELYSQKYTLVYNLGIPGDTTKGFLNRLEHELLPRINPDLENIIILAIGINDSRYYEDKKSHETSFGEYQENLPKILKIAKQYTAKIVFLGLTPVDEERTDPIFWETVAIYRNEFIKRYDLEIKEFCQRERVLFVEVFDKLIKDDVKKLMEDGIHPNDLGHQKIFEIVRDFLEEKRFI